MATDPKIDPLMFIQMFSTALDPELNMCLGAIRQVADYDIPHYLSRALACYFMTELNSFRSFPDAIAKMKKSPYVAAALVQAHARHVDQLAFVLAEGRRSVRNRVAHYEFVSAGCVNLTAQGFFLAGGGEELRLPEKLRGARLSEVLSERIMQLHSCVDDMVDTFVEAARQDQS